MKLNKSPRVDLMLMKYINKYEFIINMFCKQRMKRVFSRGRVELITVFNEPAVSNYEQ